jgi:DNA-binding NarL/FixJ family response regulator
MAAQDEAQELASGGCMADQERLAAALVAALELALLAAHRLLARLDSAAGRHAEAAEHLERALALAGPGAATGEPAEAQGRLDEGCASSVPLDGEPAPNRTESAEAGSATCTGASLGCPDGLTRRELEVLRLIAAGNSNREIAATLYLSPRTVERHVANVYLKIAAHSKAEATSYALRHRMA